MPIISKTVTNESDIEQDMIKSGKLKAGKSKNYVNNKSLLAEYQIYFDKKQNCLKNNLPIPPLTDKIALAIVQIANRHCNSRKYFGYTNNWKEELISNAIMTATIRGHSFDPNRSDNPFAYLTQICDNAFKEQLKREKKQVYIRYRSIDEVDGFNAEVEDNTNILVDSSNDLCFYDRLDFINTYEEVHNIGKARKKRSTNKVDLIQLSNFEV